MIKMQFRYWYHPHNELKAAGYIRWVGIKAPLPSLRLSHTGDDMAIGIYDLDPKNAYKNTIKHAKINNL
jgi:hypothetical protein